MPNSLTKHIKTVHEGIKDFMCSECGKAFKSNLALNSHFKVVHLKEFYECDICQMKITTLTGVQKHKKVVHEKVKSECDQWQEIFSSVNSKDTHQSGS